MRQVLAGFLFLLGASTAALAADEPMPDLPPSDDASAAGPVTRDWRIVLDVQFSESKLQGDPGWRPNEQLFARFRFDKRVAPEWRLVFDDLLALQARPAFGQQRSGNTLIDAYASWQPAPDRIVDLGRINARFGVATGFNPTDYFGANAVRSILSIDPVSLRSNRQGTVMVRGQAVWTGTSVTAIFAPKLAGGRDDSPFNPDLGATNTKDRWLLAVSHDAFRSLDLQWLLQGSAGDPVGVGVNASMLLNPSTVAYAEWSGGRTPTLQSEAFGLSADRDFHSQVSTGLTYTTRNKLSLTLEYEYNGAGLSKADWHALQQAPPVAYARYRTYAAALQAPPTRQRLFVDARWEDAFVNNLDLSAFAFHDLVDSSRQYWVEARYRWTGFDTALQWQRNVGQAASDFGSLPARQVWQAVATFYF